MLNSCGNPVPIDYIPQTFVQGALIVGQPINNILVMNTQSLTDTFIYNNGLIKNATVKISGDGKEFLLSYSDNSPIGYYNSDQTYLIKPETKYKLEIWLSDSSYMWSETTTPATTGWIRRSNHNVQYPLDSLNPLPDDTIEWKSVNGVLTYLIEVRCLDTLNYGKYLSPPTMEPNRRVYRKNMDDQRYLEITSWNLIPKNSTPVFFTQVFSFKWFGLEEISIYAPDNNYLKWFVQQIVSRQYDSQANSINGKGFGVFGSVSAARDTIFLLKNQP
jgi:hypothetical protein